VLLVCKHKYLFTISAIFVDERVFSHNNKPVNNITYTIYSNDKAM
jgi:hypothetical protein